MPTGRICHTHCPSGGGWGWLIAVIAAVAVLGAGARAAAPALGRLVHDVLLWATVAAVRVSLAAIGGYIAWSALRGRRSGANSARAIPQDGPRSAGRSGLASHDHQRRGQ